MTRRRGDELRDHILFKAKDVFLEAGFERASMDVIAARAETTKRTIYAHFENKERLFLAVFELVRDLWLSRLKMPCEYAEGTEDALALFCGRFLELLLWHRSIQMCRLGIAEADRFPEGAAQFCEAIFGTVHERLEGFLRERLSLSQETSAQVASDILGRLLHPRFTLALFGIGGVSDEWLDDESFSADFDFDFVRSTIAALVPLDKDTA